MPVGQGNELDPLDPQVLCEDEKRLVGMDSGESERARLVLAPRPVRQLRPDNSIPLAVDAWTALGELDELPAPNHWPVITRWRHIREFEGGESVV